MIDTDPELYIRTPSDHVDCLGLLGLVVGVCHSQKGDIINDHFVEVIRESSAIDFMFKLEVEFIESCNLVWLGNTNFGVCSSPDSSEPHDGTKKGVVLQAFYEKQIPIFGDIVCAVLVFPSLGDEKVVNFENFSSSRSLVSLINDLGS